MHFYKSCLLDIVLEPLIEALVTTLKRTTDARNKADHSLRERANTEAEIARRLNEYHLLGNSDGHLGSAKLNGGFIQKAGTLVSLSDSFTTVQSPDEL